jgi:hypothetical protein
VSRAATDAGPGRRKRHRQVASHRAYLAVEAEFADERGAAEALERQRAGAGQGSS